MEAWYVEHNAGYISLTYIVRYNAGMDPRIYCWEWIEMEYNDIMQLDCEYITEIYHWSNCNREFWNILWIIFTDKYVNCITGIASEYSDEH